MEKIEPDMIIDEKDITEVQCIAEKAGEMISEYYRSQEFATELKKDFSPLTDADKASNRHIVSELKRLFPQIPVISEESELPDYRSRSAWKRLWIVDPLDGTQEFIHRIGRFCVNIALIEGKKPVFGMINVISDGEILWGLRGKGCFISRDGRTEMLQPRPRTGKLRIAVSRFHVTEKELQYIDHLQERGREVEIVPLGASSKYCMMAKGEIDLLPKFGPCSEWDVAAGQVIVEATGGAIACVESGKAMEYNKPSMLVPPFIVFGKRVREMILDGNTDFQWKVDVK
ncbi:MAG: 3'(2'),5'-bisphosphate nucleotidase CysQ [Odoribacteraceae bacterium]|jgi:3'(2'), 5'-bisphosphate nucleotidase|nr:3'(2'),5'-bisphosphate nucleotidase CysQ [Odoribacteraceae bacterium]